MRLSRLVYGGLLSFTVRKEMKVAEYVTNARTAVMYAETHTMRQEYDLGVIACPAEVSSLNKCSLS